MSRISKCPVCQNNMGGQCREYPSRYDARDIDCDVCGKYRVSGTVLDDNNQFRGSAFSPFLRAALSHTIRIAQSEEDVPFIKSDWLNEFRENPRLPSPVKTAQRLIEHIGSHLQKFGTPLESLKPSACAYIGFVNLGNAEFIFRQLQSDGIVVGELIPDDEEEFYHPNDMNLTLKGWAEYEKQRAGEFGGNYAFLALQFGDPLLETFVSDVLKPCIRNELGYEVVDMRDVARAGIIDNLMREQIRDAAFVIADLTHDNSGAYWEAGYAEGLGKPVIYICEKSKFDEAKTHFDTNHCTTVVWSSDDAGSFSAVMVATARRSLGLFPKS